MIEQTEYSAEVAFGPILVMIDASKLSHSLTTALKDRPHGIPVQPNRSLPLRPPPPSPVRTLLAKSPNNSPAAHTTATTMTTVAQQATRNSENFGINVAEDNTSDDNVKNDAIPSLGVVGMNFYDSKDERANSDDRRVEKLVLKIPKDLVKYRHTKSLDADRPNESNCGDRRRKSFDYAILPRGGDGEKKKISKFSSGKTVQKEKEERDTCAKKRKLSSVEESSDVTKEYKSPKIQNSDPTHTSPYSKAVSQAEAREPVLKANNVDGVESSDVVLSTIYKYFHPKPTPPLLVDNITNLKPPDSMLDKSNWKRTSSNTYKLILPKPAIIPKCPVAIPIQVNHAMNQSYSKNSNTNGTKPLKSQVDNMRPTTNQCDSMKPRSNMAASKMHAPAPIEEIENILPSMPSLEDIMQTDGRQDKLTLYGNEVDDGIIESNVGKELISVAQARVLQESKTNNLKANELIQGNMDSIHNYKFNKPDESIVNLTTVLEVQIPGRSPELIILKAPQIMATDKVDGIAYNSQMQGETPVSLSSNIRPVMDELINIEEIKGIDTYIDLGKYKKEDHEDYQKSSEKILESQDAAEIGFPVNSLLATDHQQQTQDVSGKNEPQYTLEHKSPVEFEVRIRHTSSLPPIQEPVQKLGEDKLISGQQQELVTKDSQVKSNLEGIVRCRKNRLNLKLQKLYEEETRLKCKMSQTNDPARLTRLQQRINCAKKKIENTQKYLSKLIIIENLGLCTSPTPSRIHVRRDLVQKSPEFVDPAPQSPLRSANETDEVSTGRSPQILPPAIITISESDSDLSSEGNDTSDEKSVDNVESPPQLDTEMIFEDQNMSENNAKVTSIDGSFSPDHQIEHFSSNEHPKTTNNNIDYLNKNFPSVCGTIPLTTNSTSTSIPLIPTTENTISMNITQAPMRVITVTKNIPSLIPDSISFSPSNFNNNANQTSSDVQYKVSNVNSPEGKVDEEQSTPNSDTMPYSQGNSVGGNNNIPKYDANNYIPDTVSDLRTRNTICRSVTQENSNARPIPNYPVHRTDYETSRSVTSMFSRDNGGANINLSSPLQGHSPLPFPSPYYRNLTAEGYPMSAELGPSHQTMQWQNQHPATETSMPFTSDQDVTSRSSILDSQLLKSQIQEPADFASSVKLSNKDMIRTKPALRISKRIMNAQFPSLGNWAAQMTREPTVKKTVNHPVPNGVGYKLTGSDVYKMTATLVEPTYPRTMGTAMNWPSGKPPTEQLRDTQALLGQRSISDPYRTDYPAKLPIPYDGVLRYPRYQMFAPYPMNLYHQIPSAPQSSQSTQYSRLQPSHDHPNGQLYYPRASLARSSGPGAYHGQGNSAHLVNTGGIMPQQYVQQQPTCVQNILSQWHLANNYRDGYIRPQYNAFNVQPTPMKNNSTGYNGPTNKSLAPMQQPHHDIMTNPLIRNVSNMKFPVSVYNVPGNLNAVVQDQRNARPLDRERYIIAPHLGKVQKSSNISSSSKCSLCGMLGPKFNCLGCETAFYCNEHCQARHWGTHYIECPKKMPKLKKVS